MTERKNEDGEDATPYRLYLFLSLSGFVLAVLGLVYLFLNYTGCGLGMFFVIFTLVMGVITTIISMLNSVNKGILTPAIVFAYSVFMCWYALLSHPNEDCNPTANSNYGDQNGAIIVVCIVTFVILIYCVGNGTKILNIFNPNGEGVMMSYQDNPTSGYRSNLHATLRGESATTTQPPVATTNDAESNTTSASSPAAAGDAVATNVPDSSGTAHERFFFHILMLLVSCYGAMILTNWGQTNGAPAAVGGGRQQRESMWLIIVSQWVFLLLYVRVLQVSYNNNNKQG